MFFITFTLFALVLNLQKVFGHYDDVTSKTYDLEVPGSDPIRIIEAEPLWDRDPHDTLILTTEKTWVDFEHRALRPTTVQTKTNINNPYASNEENESEDAPVDSAEELRKFLKGYAEQLRRASTRSPFEDTVAEFDSSERFHKVELITKPSDEPTNRLASLLLNDKGNKKDEEVVKGKAKNWNLMNLGRQKTPSDDKNGWVSLEVVPWSVSKVAKWHSNKIKPNTQETVDNQYAEYSARPINSKPIWNQPNKPVVNYRPGSTNYYTKPFDYGSSNIQKPNPRPAFSPPSTAFAQKVYIQPDYTNEVPKPSWQVNSHNSYHHYDTQLANTDDPNCDYGHPGIITDGLPANFPKPHHEEHNRRKGSFSDEHPVSHPFKGDGEWVLLTTTKGYKPPNNSNGRQRSLDIESVTDLDKESISTHKSVRLTVLPPLKESKINMTTSHGGLLQVESTFQTVDEAHRMSLKKQNMKRRPIKGRPQRRPIKQSSVIPTIPTLNSNGVGNPTINTVKKGPNASTVLAAVGAGMIPATMAMLVPMMGKRRRRDLIFSTRSPNTVGLELQLPQSL